MFTSCCCSNSSKGEVEASRTLGRLQATPISPATISLSHLRCLKKNLLSPSHQFLSSRHLLTLPPKKLSQSFSPVPLTAPTTIPRDAPAPIRPAVLPAKFWPVNSKGKSEEETSEGTQTLTTLSSSIHPSLCRNQTLSPVSTIFAALLLFNPPPGKLHSAPRPVHEQIPHGETN